jgi:alanyl aminopeptidase
VIRSQLLGAMGGVDDPALAERARRLVLEPGVLRRNEIYNVLGSQVSDRRTRAVAREWIDANFDALAARVAPGGASLASLYAAGMCSARDAATLEGRFAARLKDMEGGPMELKQTIEGIQLCEAAREARRGQPLTFAAK